MVLWMWLFLDQFKQSGSGWELNRIYSQFAIWSRRRWQQTEITTHPCSRSETRSRIQQKHNITRTRSSRILSSKSPWRVCGCLSKFQQVLRFLFTKILMTQNILLYQETIPGVQVRMLKEMPLEMSVFRSERQDSDAGCLWLVILTPQPGPLIGRW